MHPKIWISSRGSGQSIISSVHEQPIIVNGEIYLDEYPYRLVRQTW